MIRFILKSALGIGILAMVLPLGSKSQRDMSGVDVFAVLSGAQEAVADIGGFCGRSPRACEAGREVAIFTGERIEAGLQISYGYLNDKLAPSSGAVAQRREARPDPVMTGAIADAALPRTYTPPRVSAVPLLAPAFAAQEAPRGTVAVPSPAPRT